MRNYFPVSAVLLIAIYAATTGAVAQTGEFAAPVTGQTMHQAYGLQDWLQSLRNPELAPPPAAAAPVGPPVEIVPQAEAAPVKPKKVAKSNRVPPQPPQ